MKHENAKAIFRSVPEQVCVEVLDKNMLGSESRENKPPRDSEVRGYD